jgi:hypothetical protein
MEILRVFDRLPDNRHKAWEYLYIVGITTESGGTPADILAECTACRNTCVIGEDHIGGPRRQFSPWFGRACLKDHWATLWASIHIEWAPDLKKLSFMIEKVHLFDIKIYATLLVASDSTFVPTFPKTRHDIEEFIGAFIARRMVDMAVKTKILSLVLIERCDEIPTSTPATYMIKRVKSPSDVVWLVEGCARGRNETKMSGCHSQSGE